MPTLEEIRSNLLSPEEASRVLPFSTAHILDLARKGQLPCIHIRRKVFFRASDLAWILSQGLPTLGPILRSEE
jgi:hypothetical protein